mmetsp:Transcript_15198/g.59468  ORF Transcript_15198/g.59468 Transcript_15198/m.59468 type:complete len:350 (+) Transcript_15198:60-1109(+)
MNRFRNKPVVCKVPNNYPLPFHLTYELACSKSNTIYLAVPRTTTELHSTTKPLPVTNQKIVVKSFLPSAPHSKSNAKHEARIMQAAGQHPNICEYYGLYSQHGRMFLAMQHCDMDLFSHAFPSPMKGPSLSEPQAMNIFAQIILGLEHLHSKNIVHCDIKLENIFIRSNGQAVIGDYGLSKRYDPNSVRTYGPGTVIYGAPETCLGLKVKGPEIDIWSCGVVLYLLLEGFFPFDGDTSFEIIKSISSMKGGPRYSKASMQARELIDSLLEIQPDNRITIAEIKKVPIVARHLRALAGEETPRSRNRKARSVVDMKAHQVKRMSKRGASMTDMLGAAITTNSSAQATTAA